MNPIRKKAEENVRRSEYSFYVTTTKGGTGGPASSEHAALQQVLKFAASFGNRFQKAVIKKNGRIIWTKLP